MVLKDYDYLRMNMENPIRQRYIAKTDIILTRVSGACDTNVSVLSLGMLAESVEDKFEDDQVVIRVVDSNMKTWCNTEWRCTKKDLVPILPGTWSFLLPVTSPQDRLRIAVDKSLCQALENIKTDDSVWYCDQPNSDRKSMAIVKFVGPVPHNKPGSYFVLDVLEQQEPMDTTTSNKKYHPTQNSVGKMATASNVVPMNLKISTANRHLNKPRTDDGTNNNHDAIHSGWIKNEVDNYLEKNEEKTEDVRVGSNVKVVVNSKTQRGIIRWIGTNGETAPGKLMAVVELDDGQLTDDASYFQSKHKTIFTNVEHCSHLDNPSPTSEDLIKRLTIDDFGNVESSIIGGMVRPITVKDDMQSICGKYRGIQGHHNSCYLDATLFSMFAFTCVFDNLLFRPPNEKDCSQYEEVQRVLREEIVNPLRKEMFVRADRVMKLRTLLEKLSSVSGLTSEEKDPEEFLTSLVAQILNGEPFLKLNSGQDAYHYQLFVEKDDHLNLPTVQQLLEQSFLTSNVKLKEVPSCFIIQMPRFGKSFKMYPKIQPTLLLDVTDIIENSPRQCTVCGKLAEYECKECYGQCGVGLESISFCSSCLAKVHRHECRTNHEPKKLTFPMEFAALKDHCPVPRLFLELSAVVCIETSHYVSFVKCGPGSEAPWCFFDSMADRKGEKNGYNIPEMVPCPDFPYWLSDEGRSFLTESTDDRQLPEHAKRLLCDAYMCMYQSPDVMMYK